MICSACNIELTVEELGKRIRCDSCRAYLCQGCSGLNATEVRVMQLTGGRTLKLSCSLCVKTGPGITSDVILDNITELMDRRFDFHCAALKVDFANRMEGLTEQINILRETNIQLIHLVSPRVHVNVEPKRVPEVLNLNSVGISSRPDAVAADQAGPTVINPSSRTSISRKSGSQFDVHEPGGNSRAKSDVTTGNSGANAEEGSVGRHRRTYSAVVGVKNPATTCIQAAPRIKKTSVAVSRLALEVTEDNLAAYLKKTFGADEEFMIEKMVVRSGTYNCFRVEARLELLGVLLDPNNWTEGVAVRKFRFFRKPSNTEK